MVAWVVVATLGAGTLRAAAAGSTATASAGTGTHRPSVPWRRHVIDSALKGADGVRLRDANGDGRLDVATGWEEGGGIRVCLNPGPSACREQWRCVTVGTVGDPEDAVLVDLDGDGAIDVVSSCEGRTRSIFVHWAPSGRDRYLDPSAWQTQPLPAAQNKTQWMYVLPLKIDGQHGIDLIAGSKGADGMIGWFQSPPRPRNLDDWKWHPLRRAGWVMSLIAEDMDGDGDVDILISDRKGDHRGCFWLQNPGPATSAEKPWREHAIGGEDRELMFVTVADLDGDGLQDVVAATRGHELLYFRRLGRDGLKWKTCSVPIPKTAGTGKAVSVGDIDLDGRPDIVFSCEQAAGKSGVMWMSCRHSPCDGDWILHSISGHDGTKFDLVALIDLDGDEDLDVMTTEEVDNLGVIWWENPARAKAVSRTSR